MQLANDDGGGTSVNNEKLLQEFACASPLGHPFEQSVPNVAGGVM